MMEDDSTNLMNILLRRSTFNIPLISRVQDSDLF